MKAMNNLNSKWNEVLKSMSASIHKVGVLEVRKLNTSRDKLSMMFEFENIPKITEAGIELFMDMYTQNEYEPLLSNEKQILLMEEGVTQSVLLYDVVITGVVPYNQASIWLFTCNKTAHIVCLSGLRYEAETGRPILSAMLAVNEFGKIIHECDEKSYSCYDDFLEEVARKELLESKIEVDLESRLAYTNNLVCECKKTDNARYVIITAEAHGNGHAKKNWSILYDMKEQKPVYNKLFKKITKLNGLNNIYKGVYKAVSAVPPKQSRVIDLLGNEDEPVELGVFDKFELIDGYYCYAYNKFIHANTNIAHILKFDLEKRTLERLPLELLRDFKYTVSKNRIVLIEDGWDKRAVCSIGVKDKYKSKDDLIAEGDDIVYLDLKPYD